ncbi:MAG: hypothetical protein D6713_09280 [Deltaproteobacteria bacterium]|nr:MAG: hypothetical protein D6713_09280 [Deltaproteobacteria bacterium]
MIPTSLCFENVYSTSGDRGSAREKFPFQNLCAETGNYRETQKKKGGPSGSASPVRTVATNQQSK